MRDGEQNMTQRNRSTGLGRRLGPVSQTRDQRMRRETQRQGKRARPVTTQELPSPVRSEVDAADAQVIAGPYVAGLELKGPTVRGYSFFTLVSVGQGGPQLVPQQIVLGQGWRRVRNKSRAWIHFRPFLPLFPILSS